MIGHNPYTHVTYVHSFFLCFSLHTATQSREVTILYYDLTVLLWEYCALLCFTFLPPFPPFPLLQTPHLYYQRELQIPRRHVTCDLLWQRRWLILRRIIICSMNHTLLITLRESFWGNEIMHQQEFFWDTNWKRKVCTSNSSHHFYHLVMISNLIHLF